MTIDINKLRRLAQAATPGPWYATGKLTRYVEARIDGGLIQEVAACGPTKADGGYGPQQEANARLIAAANPAAISELLDRLEAAEKERDEVAQQLVQSEQGKRKVNEECDALRAKIASINEAWKSADRACHDLTEKVIPNLREQVEAAESDAAHQRALAESALRVAEGWERKCDTLRAKIAEMEQQEPVGVLHVGSCYGEELQDWEFEANQCACDKLNEAYVSNPTSLPLYTLPGAQAQPAKNAVAYLDLGTGGYVDVGTDLTDEELAALPKGRHMLGIIGTYGVDGYVPAQPAPSVPDISDDMMRDARRYKWLRNDALHWYAGPEYSTYNDVVCSGECCNLAGAGIALDSRIDEMLAEQEGKR